MFASIVVPTATAGPAMAANACTPPVVNRIACENSKPGDPKSDWYLESTYGDIGGFTTEISAQPGETVRFKIKVAKAYSVSIYRLGWYGGNGARKVAQLSGAARTQPACLSQASTGLVDCGNWSVSQSWLVPTDAVSGLYIANVSQNDGQAASQIPFVVRDDASTSAVLVQTSDQTWQAYNAYGGSSMYNGTATGSNDGRALKVSYNRPLENVNPTNTFFNAEYAMLRWLERNGYDVSYTSGVDTARRGALLTNHKVFVSSGHDEYWSHEQRANVEAAKAAGVNLAFFSGNEMFWKTRFEPSVDGTATSYRTLVCYKETKAGAKIDPSPQWTGTWRDPRFSPPADGGRPENALIGQLFTVNGYRDDAIKVPATYAGNRFWRNTSIAALAAGQTATLPLGTLGYEWDEDVDNGFRPDGSINLSSTTVNVSSEQHLKDFGNVYGAGTPTHKMSLYRDRVSGALVFGAGTVQWSWGLDSEHAYPRATADARMQQATVNLLADMGAQPTTLQPGLIAASRSTDVAGPGVTIGTPVAGSTVPAGKAFAVTGTAVDSGGGSVARVEVSLDGGKSWREATGLNTWSFSWTPDAVGPASLLVRAVDDSANIGVTSTTTVTVGPQQCPCTIFPPSSVPTMPAANDTNAIELGVKFKADVNGFVTGIRFYKGTGNIGTHTGTLWSAAGVKLATGTFTGESATGWQQLVLESPIAVKANTTYVASYYAPAGRYAVDSGYFTGKGAGLAPLFALADGVSGASGVYRYGTSAFPTNGGGSNYWVDLNFATTSPDSTPPTLAARSPLSGAVDVPITSPVFATFSEQIDQSTLAVTLRDAAGNLAPTMVSYDMATRRAKAAPTSRLALAATYTATVEASDTSLNPMVPQTWTFTTSATPPPITCPCTVFGDSVPGTTASTDSNGIELGMRFRADVDGWVTGVRFYKGAGNTGSHTGSLWTGAGTLLARGSFGAESAAGWQTMSFDTPVAVRKATTYVVSYYAPNGRYAFDRDYFTGKPADTPPLVALASGTDGQNGLYRYGSTSVFPDSSFVDTNYWVDVSFRNTATDTTPPTVTSRSPVAGALNVATSTKVNTVFSENVDGSSVTVDLRDASGVQIAGATTYDVLSRTATFTPGGPLAQSATYTVSVTARDAAHNNMPAPDSWTFLTTNAAPASACPCSIFASTAVPGTADSGDRNAVELGVRVRTEVGGRITGIRFYKGAANTGTHTGSLWTNTGVQLATGTFAAESASGWQTLVFSTPVTVTAGTVYVASYHAPVGGYSVDGAFFANAGVTNGPLTALRDGVAGGNGLYQYGTSGFPSGTFNAGNYWVDVIFEPSP